MELSPYTDASQSRAATSHYATVYTDIILDNFDDSLEVKVGGNAVGPRFDMPNPKPPKPPDTGKFDPKVDYNRVLLPMKPGHENEQAKESKPGVEYPSASERERYRVETGAMLTRDGDPFDTKSVKEPYLRAGSISMQSLDGATDEQVREWAVNSCIWVCLVPEGQQSVAFYSHVCRGGKFHHSSLSKGGTVVGAGEWIVKNGKLRTISANSGHYQPTLDFLFRSVLHLADSRHPDTSIFLYDVKTRTWVDRPWKDFIEAPSANGRYGPHPSAIR